MNKMELIGHSIARHFDRRGHKPFFVLRESGRSAAKNYAVWMKTFGYLGEMIPLFTRLCKDNPDSGLIYFDVYTASSLALSRSGGCGGEQSCRFGSGLGLGFEPTTG